MSSRVLRINDDDYEIMGLIDKGTFGRVFKAIKVGEYDDKFYAIKVVKTRENGLIDYLKSEIATLTYLSRVLDKTAPFVRIYDSQILKKGNECIVLMVTEYLSGQNLYDFIEKHAMTSQLILTMFRQILLAVNMLHQMNIAHRDLKLENIMVVDDCSYHCPTPVYRVVLIDFGMSCNRNLDYFLSFPDRSEVSRRCTEITKIGTKVTMDPVLGVKTDLTFSEVKATDLWSLGVILFRMVYGEYLNESSGGYINYIRNRVTKFSPILESLFQSIEKRESASEIIDRFKQFLGLSQEYDQKEWRDGSLLEIRLSGTTIGDDSRDMKSGMLPLIPLRPRLTGGGKCLLS